MKRKPEIIIMVGNIGAGKSTLVKQFVELGYRVVSKDAIRYMLGGGEYIFDVALERQVDTIAKSALIELTYAGYNVIVDETNTTSLERKDYLHYIRGDYEKTALVFPKISKEESVKRRLQSNHGNTSKEVWEQVWEDKNSSYQVPTKKEGFDTIKEVTLQGVTNEI